MKTKYYTRPGFEFFSSLSDEPNYLMGVNDKGWSAYFSDGSVNFHGKESPFDYSNLVEQENWIECEYPADWKMYECETKKLDIAAEIKRCLMNDGYGKTAAELHVNAITQSVFEWAYHLGRKDKEIT